MQKKGCVKMDIEKEIEKLKQKKNEHYQQIGNIDEQIELLKSKLPNENKYKIHVGMWDCGSVSSKEYSLDISKEEIEKDFEEYKQRKIEEYNKRIKELHWDWCLEGIGKYGWFESKSNDYSSDYFTRENINKIIDECN